MSRYIKSVGDGRFEAGFRGGPHAGWLWLAIAAFCLAGAVRAPAGHVHLDFLTDPSASLDFIGDASWPEVNGHTADFVQITDAKANQRGTVIFGDLDGGMNVKAFTFSCDLKLGNGTEQPGDGLSINFARNSDPVLASYDGNGFAGDPDTPPVSMNLPEEGTTTGIAIGFDAIQNGPADVVGISVRVDNNVLIQVPMPTLNGSVDDWTSLQTGPIDPPNVGSGSQFKWAPFKAELKANGDLNVWWKNHQIITNLATSFIPGPGRFVISGRTDSASYEFQAVQNVDITTVPTAVPQVTSVTGYAAGFTAVVQDAGWITVAPATVTVKLDGAATRLPAVSREGTNTVIQVDTTPKYLVYGTRHTVTLGYGDINGGGATNDYPFTINGYAVRFFAQTNYMIEAEDFNFDGGQFIDDPIPSSGVGETSYFGRVGVANIDEYDPSENNTNHTYRPYDPISQTGEMVGTEPVGIDESSWRQKFIDAAQIDPGVMDQDVCGVDVGEWWNYTRTFSNCTYKVFARLACGTNTLFTARFDKVTSSQTNANQTTVPLGTFVGGGTGGWQQYLFFPLTDALGNEVVLRLSGEQTLRFTLVSGELNANFFMFVPTAVISQLPPMIALASPANGATNVSLRDKINITITERDNKIFTNTVKLWINSNDVTAAAKIIKTSSGATIAVESPTYLPDGATNIIALAFADSYTGVVRTNSWSFTTAMNPVPHHPADLNPADYRLMSSEVLAYATAWKTGQQWPLPPNPIPMSYVARAGALWMGGGSYTNDPNVVAGAQYWINLAPATGQPGGTAARTLPSYYTTGTPLTVSIALTPNSSVSAIAVEDVVPAGWVVSNMSDDGGFDSVNGKVRWGSLTNNNTRTLSYQVTPGAGAAGAVLFQGRVNFDGVLETAIGGQLQMTQDAGAPPRLAIVRAKDSQGNPTVEITWIAAEAPGYYLQYNDMLGTAGHIWSDEPVGAVTVGTLKKVIIPIDRSGRAQFWFRLQR